MPKSDVVTTIGRVNDELFMYTNNKKQTSKKDFFFSCVCVCVFFFHHQIG